MKNAFKSLIAVIALTTTVAFAGNDNATKSSSFRSGMYVSKDGKLNVNIEKKETAKTSVAVKDLKGNTIYETYVSKKPSTYSIKLDMSELKAGEYTIEIKNGDQSESKSVTISEPKVETNRRLVIE